jgi:hypothetical protein
METRATKDPGIASVLQATSVLAALFVLLKAFAVSNYSLTTTGALITTAPLTVLLGSLASYLYLMLAVMALMLPVWLYRNMAELNRYVLVIGAVVAVVSIMFVPVPDARSAKPLLQILLYALAVAAALALLFGALARSRMFAQIQPRRGALPALLLGLGLGLLVVPTLARPWVPAEVLVLRETGVPADMHLRDGEMVLSKYPIVYVLSDSGGWTSALDAETRLLVRVPSSNVAARMVCHHSSQLPGTGTLWLYLNRKSYRSPNASCETLIEEKERMLDVMVTTPKK